MEVCWNLKPLALLRHLVSPPFPWRHSSHSRQLEYAVGGTTSVAARHNQLIACHLNAESVFPPLQCLHVDASRLQRLFGCLVLIHLHYAHLCIVAFFFQLCTSHVHHVLAPHLNCRRHHWRHAFAQRVADVRSTVVPAEHIILSGSLGHGGNTQHHEKDSSHLYIFFVHIDQRFLFSCTKISLKNVSYKR